MLNKFHPRTYSCFMPFWFVKDLKVTKADNTMHVLTEIDDDAKQLWEAIHLRKLKQNSPVLNISPWANLQKNHVMCDSLGPQSTQGFWVDVISKDLELSSDNSGKNFTHCDQSGEHSLLSHLSMSNYSLSIEWVIWHCIVLRYFTFSLAETQ